MTDLCDPSMDEVMTPNPIAIDSEARLSEAKQIMNQHGIRHLPVMDSGIVEGIVNERDILHCSTLGHRYQKDDEFLIKDVCTSRIHLADVNDPLGKVLRIMAKQHLDAVLLLRDGEMAGIFTESDACRIMAKHMGYMI